MQTARMNLVLLVGVALSSAVHAAAIDAVLPLDTDTSHLSLSVTLNGNQVASASIPFIGGTFDATIEQTGTSPPPLNLTDVSGAVNAGPFTINTVLGNLS